MHLRQFCRNEAGVTPVIGIILMVAITVILASIVAVFVLGFGGDSDMAPNPSFETTEHEGNLTIEIRAGDSFVAEQVDVVYEDDNEAVEGTWNEFTDDVSGESEVRASDEIVIGSSDGDGSEFDVDGTSWAVDLYWESEDGDTRELLFSDSA